ncbi:hypothetical protein NGRA_0555 [Nosema granulosis]|uniref:Uncharacterized protein n=1 Tax=Nosema granulosis TaxID=83296 RepID=A0A9P6H0P7_9MICR|nr:hypothetical protein NGRA_0555 [Nosema granulosis]
MEKFATLSPYDSIFVDNQAAIEFCQNTDIFVQRYTCPMCTSNMSEKNYSRAADGIIYRCRMKSCKKNVSIKTNSNFLGLNVPTHRILRCIYAWTMNYTNYQATHLSGISEPTFIKIKDRIQEWLHVDTSFKIGGEGVEIQIDETAICNGKIIINPSSTHDSNPNTQWLIGGIENNQRKNFFLELVPNRKFQLFVTYLNKG